MQVKRCKRCGAEFTCRESKRKFCSKECGNLFKKEKVLIFRTCIQCGISIQTTESENQIFCSKSCSNKSRKLSEDTKSKISSSLRGNTFCKGVKEYFCKACGKPYSRRYRKACSQECAKKLMGKDKGGYREKGGRGKSGHFLGHFLQSTWELAFLLYCLGHSKRIERNTQICFEYFHKESNHKFFPDFKVEGELIEIKGWPSEVNTLKEKASEGKVKFLYQKDLEEVFKWVEKETQLPIKNLYLLYEENGGPGGI